MAWGKKKQAKAVAATATVDPGAREDGRIRSLVTPEGVDLKLLAGRRPGERASAVLIDLAIMLGVLDRLLHAGVAAGHGGSKGKGWEVIGTAALLVFFVLRNLYFCCCSS